MHIKSLFHVRDHVKVQGRAYDLLMYIALHTNMHTGEAFELTIERQAHRHQITPEWTRMLLNGVIATGELLVERSRGRHPNRYRFPLERCQACQGDHPTLEEGEDLNPKVELGDDVNPKVPSPQPPTEPQSGTAPTPKWTPANPKVGSGATPRLAWIEPRKEFKELKERKERGATPKCREEGRNKPETHSPWWCPAHGYCHGERQPDHRPDCWLESLQDLEGVRPTSMRLTPPTEAEPWLIAQVFDTHRWSEA